MGGSPKPPDVVKPGEAAQAAVGTAGAGEMMSIANQPVEQYSNLYTTSKLGPAETQTQTALANQAALQSAQGQQAIQSQVDPQAFAQRQMRMQAANKRLGQLYGVDPTAFSYSAPGAFAPGSVANVPSLSTLSQAGGIMAKDINLASVNKAGANPQLTKNNPVNLPASYLG